MLPLSLLRAAEASPILIELKSGDTYNGRLLNCDSWMNINLKDVICTSADGSKFWKMNECYIRGSSIKYLRLPDEVVDKVSDDDKNFAGRGSAQGRGGRGGRVGGSGGRFQSSGRGGGRGGRDGGRGGRIGRGGGARYSGRTARGSGSERS